MFCSFQCVGLNSSAKFFSEVFSSFPIKEVGDLWRADQALLWRACFQDIAVTCLACQLSVACPSGTATSGQQSLKRSPFIYSFICFLLNLLLLQQHHCVSTLCSKWSQRSGPSTEAADAHAWTALVIHRGGEELGEGGAAQTAGGSYPLVLRETLAALPKEERLNLLLVFGWFQSPEMVIFKHFVQLHNFFFQGRICQPLFYAMARSLSKRF